MGGDLKAIVFKNKLKGLKEVLNQWNMENKEKYKSHKNNILSLIASLDKKMDEAMATPDEINQQLNFLQQLNEIENRQMLDVA